MNKEELESFVCGEMLNQYRLDECPFRIEEFGGHYLFRVENDNYITKTDLECFLKIKGIVPVSVGNWKGKVGILFFLS